MTNDYGNLELHTVLLAAMKDIDKICRENGLRYYLHAGTLLGAMNYKGFIPWDDDVDISLFRNDYEELLTILQKDYSDKYFIHTYRSEETFSHNRAVLRVLGTTVMHNGTNIEKHSEIGMDIVPLDAAPDSKILRAIQRKSIEFWDIVVQMKRGTTSPQSVLGKMVFPLSKINRVKLGEIIDWICKWFDNKNTREIGLLCYTSSSPYNNKRGYDDNLVPREDYYNPIEVDFEGEKFYTISKPERDLDRRYPKWREPYPEDKRVTKHDVKSYEISDEVRKRVGL